MTLITIQELVVPGEYHGTLTGPFVARLEALEDFSSSDGQYIPKGAGYHGFGQEFTCVLASTIFTIGSGDAYATTDSSKPNTKYKRLAIYDTSTGRLIKALYRENGIQIPNNISPTNWEALRIYTEGSSTTVVTDMDLVNDLIMEQFTALEVELEAQFAALTPSIPIITGGGTISFVSV